MDDSSERTDSSNGQSAPHAAGAVTVDADETSHRARRRLFRRQLWGIWLVMGVMLAVSAWGVYRSRQRHPIDFRRQGEAVAYKIDINVATWQELTTLRGIGPKRAQDIVAWRREHGPFESAEDLKRIKGVGDSLVEGIRNDIAF
jgi:competence ComEA-like helix-hairpin-helix protein